MIVKNGRIFFPVPYSDRDRARMIPGSLWHPAIKVWSFPALQAEAIKKLCPAAADDIDRSLRDWRADRKDFIKKAVVIREEMNAASDEEDLDLQLAAIKLPENFKRRPYKHQERMLRYLLLKGRALLSAEMGTGKTQVGVNFIDIMDAVPALIVCPLSVIPAWESEVEACCERPFVTITGSPKGRAAKLADAILDRKIAIINYDGILSTAKLFSHWDKFKTVILDESSYIKSPRAQRTKLILKLFKDAAYKICMSGTPITQSPVDIFTQYNFLDPKFLGFGNFYAFRNTYCRMGGYGNYQVIGYNNLHILKRDINRRCIVIKKEDIVEHEMPDKLYHVRYVEMSSELKAQYTSMKDDLVLELSTGEELTAPLVLTKILRLQQILSGGFLPKEKNEKLKILEEVSDEILSCGHSVVIWTRFVSSYTLLSAIFRDKGHSISLISGDTKDRGAEIEKFQSGENKIMICQVDAGGFGITLTRAHHAIYWENVFSLEKRRQSEDRIHRIGQKETCHYIDLVYRGSIDEKVLAAIQKKQDIALSLIDSFRRGEYRIKREDK